MVRYNINIQQDAYRNRKDTNVVQRLKIMSWATNVYTSAVLRILAEIDRASPEKVSLSASSGETVAHQ